MKCRVKRVFEYELEAALEEINEGRHELLRILEMPAVPVNARDCDRCSEDLCKIHNLSFIKEGCGLAPEVVGFESIFADFPRYALVYRQDAD